MQGQIALMDWLSEKIEGVSTAALDICEVVNVKANPICDYKVTSTYRDIFIIINMIDDYVRLLKSKDETMSTHEIYMVAQFERISESLAAQIQLDKELMYKKCSQKKSKDKVKTAGEILPFFCFFPLTTIGTC